MVDASACLVDRIAYAGELLGRRVVAVVPQPQALAEHFAHGIADGIGAVFAGNRLDLGLRDAQAISRASAASRTSRTARWCGERRRARSSRKMAASTATTASRDTTTVTAISG